MAEHEQAYCHRCGQHRLHVWDECDVWRPDRSLSRSVHLFHLVLTVLTLGIWVVVWFAHIASMVLTEPQAVSRHRLRPRSG